MHCYQSNQGNRTFEIHQKVCRDRNMCKSSTNLSQSANRQDRRVSSTDSLNE